MAKSKSEVIKNLETSIRVLEKKRKEEEANQRSTEEFQRAQGFIQEVVQKLGDMKDKDGHVYSVFEIIGVHADKLVNTSLQSFNTWNAAIMDLAQTLSQSTEAGNRIVGMVLLMGVDKVVSTAERKAVPYAKAKLDGIKESISPSGVELPKLIHEVRIGADGRLTVTLEDSLGLHKDKTDTNMGAIDTLFTNTVKDWLREQGYTEVEGKANHFTNLDQPKLEALLRDPNHGLGAWMNNKITGFEDVLVESKGLNP